MLYSYFVKKLIRQSFDHVNDHCWDELVRPVAPNVQPYVIGEGFKTKSRETRTIWIHITS
jgi:hypothetical protein